MTRTVADDLWLMLKDAGVKRCYGIVGDALNPTIDALFRHSEIEFVHVRHEEWGAFAASAEAQLSEGPVAVCGTAGPGVTHLINGLLDAKHENASVITIAGDVETNIIDTDGLEEVSPYDLFRTCSLYTGRAINTEQSRAVFQQAITVSLDEGGPTVIALPGDVAGAKSPLDEEPSYTRSKPAVLTPSDDDIAEVARLVNDAEKVMIFGGKGCKDSASAVRELSEKLNAPVGFSLKGKSWLEADTPNAVGMTGLLGYGGCHKAIKEADLILMLGSDFPFPAFLTVGDADIVQVDTRARHLGRRVNVVTGVQADVGAFLAKLLPAVDEKKKRHYLDAALKTTQHWAKDLRAYVDRGESRSPIRPEYLAATLDELMADNAVVSLDTGTPAMWGSHQITYGGDRRAVGSLSWASMACASPYAFGAWKADPTRQCVALCGDGGFSMLALGDLWTEVLEKAPIVHVVVNNEMLDFVNIEQEEAGLKPHGTDLPNPDFAALANAMGAKGIRVEDPKDVRSAVQEALNHRGGPVVLDVRVDKYALSMPAGVPAETVKGFTLSMFKQAMAGDLENVFETGKRNIRLL